MPTPVIISVDEPQANNIFCYATLEDKQQGTLYIYATGEFPEMSLDGKQRTQQKIVGHTIHQ